MQWASLIRSIFFSVKKYDILVTKTSGQSNLTTGCIATAHKWFNGICQVAPVCTRLIHAFFGPLESRSRIVTESVRPLLQGSLLSQTYRQTDQQAGGFLRPDCAPSSECPRASIAARRRTAGSITISLRVSCYCSNAIAGIDIGANFKMYLLHQVCSSQNFFTIHSRHRCKK